MPGLLLLVVIVEACKEFVGVEVVVIAKTSNTGMVKIKLFRIHLSIWIHSLYSLNQ
ncbi:hypothetical protein GCM10007416_23570 [Kroppenstedtia guangzhouensis]|uniref:Uncharacterized protein n=1 Tax=Kroppenstedtia guangzhouensis TaxID=1274356 RepID=A0ABQ1GSS4_9BACL|nr:hypothetical protein GCM10007416_23570 [Kroppenstedtia guangzhouensis]